MKARMLVAILAAFMAVTFTPYHANADGQCQSGVTNWHCDGACNSQYRISKNDATCLSAWWDNTPPASTGFAMGSTYGTQNLCADYGDIVAHIDIKIGADEHMHLGNSTKIRGVDNDQDVRQISCCINRSDLCWKDQVEKITSGSNAGTVRVYRVENGQRMQSHEDVSTHQARFDLCERWPDYIYCEVDPEGDAFTDPSPPVADLRARTCGTANTRACNCGDHFCDEGDCEWHWQQSSASQTCIILSDSISMPANDGTTYECTVQARCRGGWGGGRNYPTSYTGNMTVFPRLSNCSGTLRLGAC